MDMQMNTDQIETTIDQTSTEPRRIMMRPEVPETEQRKEVKRRNRFDSALDRFVTPDERDEIRAFQAKHGGGRYPAKYQKEVEAVEAKRVQKKANSIGVVAKPTSVPKPANSGADIYTARMFSADLAKEFTAKIAQLPAEMQVQTLELFEKKFLEYKNK